MHFTGSQKVIEGVCLVAFASGGGGKLIENGNLLLFLIPCGLLHAVDFVEAGGTYDVLAIV